MAERTLTVRAPGKLNLTLDVLYRRPDRYHEIRSLMIAVGLWDELVFTDDPRGEIAVTSNAKEVPTDHTNLIVRAAELLRSRLGSTRGVAVHLEKRIPIGGGMGGGSSDAAAALQALNVLWGGDLSLAELAVLGAEIGSDVPFFFTGGCAIVGGRGEIVRPVRMVWTGFAALAYAGEFVSTPAVFDRCTPQGPESPHPSPEELLSVPRAGALDGRLRNDLASAVLGLFPRVRRVHDGMKDSGLPVHVTGAGAVLFALHDERDSAEAWCARAGECGAAAAWVVAAPVFTELGQEGLDSHGNHRRAGQVDR